MILKRTTWVQRKSYGGGTVILIDDTYADKLFQPVMVGIAEKYNLFYMVYPGLLELSIHPFFLVKGLTT